MMQWTVRLETTTSAGEVTTTELVTFSRPGVVSTLAEVGLVLAETKMLLSRLQASMLWGVSKTWGNLLASPGLISLADA